MSKYVVKGGNRLEGEVSIQGSKNAALPILAATVLNQGESIISNVPDIHDVDVMIKILKSIGCRVQKEGNLLVVDSSNVSSVEVSESLVREMRSSIILLGALLSKHKETVFSYPGGCDIGLRPIDIHLMGLRKLGAEITESHGYIYCKADKLYGNNITLDFPSVGATENIMLAASLAEGETIIRNAAKEPEIADLQNFINAMGGNVSGAGSGHIVIKGASKLNDVKYRVTSDRIVAGTYLAASAITEGNVLLRDVAIEDLRAVCAKLAETGCKITVGENGEVWARGPKTIQPIESLITQPYPGFPTDMQAQVLALLTLANGTSVVNETIFESRYKHVPELIRMGAHVKIEGRIAIVQGVKKLMGADVKSTDLRGGASLILAGLAAEGTTTIHSIDHIHRGYEKLDENLRSLGANIIRQEE
ncbi:UDP-N-acetylglucosamine 1-carboxyvinyltransferase [Alkalibaculum bacchi]|uniref:UDP-N-acetylglucosamine 1-carboxyvinyltransferase n=1 Tax=Alkalibaculum bacchi TaxID=645887 RepID=A0A366I4Y6_9FIRM|nr:UDP-N-acetylglucosamine 1-carboxyvinyltransferase [Alkalibaculum bacchi]RBP61812.1 UDP-N-acetylglucosamine 1-carboxyvinyltransferase [Alkalibaculum bacchi]